MIRHAALFRLVHAERSEAESRFLVALEKLGSIPGVRDFQIAREVSPKNPFTFAVSMTFKDEAAYAVYNEHPSHVAFVQELWVPQVAEFMEHDTVSLEERP